MFRCFPSDLQQELRALEQDRICDIRLYAGRPCVTRLTDGEFVSQSVTDAQQVYDTAQALSSRMLRLSPESTGEGYLTLRGGHRMGLCGRVTQGRDGLLLHEVGSVCIRVAHEVIGSGRQAARSVLEGGGQGVLLCGMPGSGKTTMLRDAVRLLSDGGLAVGLTDERGEVAACQHGVPQLDVGLRTHVVDGCRKAEGLRWLLRAMSPSLLAMDELYGAQECAAVREAAACGVPVLATVHAGSAYDLCARRGMMTLLTEGVFGQVLFVHERRVACVASAQETVEAACLRG